MLVHKNLSRWALHWLKLRHFSYRLFARLSCTFSGGRVWGSTFGGGFGALAGKSRVASGASHAQLLSIQKAHDFSPAESLSSSEEITVLEFIESGDDTEDGRELDYIPPLLPAESEEDYDWDSE
jgi:hypothetical protein